MKKERSGIIILMFVMLILGTAPRTEAANMIKTARANSKELGNQVKKGNLYRKGTKIRFRFKNGKKAKDIWLYYKKNVYYFKKSGNARRNRFFQYDGKWYYADKEGHVLYKKWIIKKKKKYYYLKKDGTRAAGETLTIGGRKYVFKDNGRLDLEKSDSIASDEFLFVGDSRTVGMGMSIADNKSSYIGQVSMGLPWLVSTAGPQAKKILSSKPDINVVFCFGVNDPDNISGYISWYNSLLKAYPKANIYFMSVNPCGSGRADLNNAIAAFNKRLKKAFKDRYIDTWTYLNKNGFSAWDGVHYTAVTYAAIYQYTVNFIRTGIPVV